MVPTLRQDLFNNNHPIDQSPLKFIKIHMLSLSDVKNEPQVQQNKWTAGGKSNSSQIFSFNLLIRNSQSKNTENLES